MPRAFDIALGKEIPRKKNRSLPRALRYSSRQRNSKKKALCRGPVCQPSAKTPWKITANLTTTLLCRGPPLALGKYYAECPKKGPRQRVLRRRFFSRGFFTEGCPRQILRRRLKSLCRGLQALGKDPASSSGSSFVNLPATSKCVADKQGPAPSLASTELRQYSLLSRKVFITIETIFRPSLF